ncbi:MAG: DUF1580 domain-containing protein [Planctomycetes bacterium]|nr:DUF1580 domain-containing protein [Planctomycetota bacterium]
MYLLAPNSSGMRGPPALNIRAILIQSKSTPLGNTNRRTHLNHFELIMNLLDETLISPLTATRLVPGQKKKVHVATVFRWMSIGSRGVKLESVRVGGCRYTSREAILRFIVNCSRTPEQMCTGEAQTTAPKADSRTEKVLAEAGFSRKPTIRRR